MAPTLDEAAIAKYTALFDDLSLKAGGATKLAKNAAGLHLSGLAVEPLMKIWSLADLDKDDLLSKPEFLICCALVGDCARTGASPPEVCPPDLIDAATHDPGGRSTRHRLPSTQPSSRACAIRQAAWYAREVARGAG